MLRAVCALLFAVSLGVPASAITLTVESDKLTYNVGETITLIVRGDDEGTPEGAYCSAFGSLRYSAALTDPGTGSGQSPIGAGWATGTLPMTDGSATAFDQLDFQFGPADHLSPGGTPFATVKLIAQAVGIVQVDWDPNTLIFFGLTSAPGTSFTIVPEPGTASLLGVGLIALALRHRRY
jgi:PEP-CTERM motif-containing protein